ncbi:MAG: hypothetical protein U5K43_06130 [Halofilum sp. (in: g-proteobacteria)]|nr:hypothetical protein [Halofilum sp. (in: g-proteobacteria)]
MLPSVIFTDPQVAAVGLDEESGASGRHRAPSAAASSSSRCRARWRISTPAASCAWSPRPAAGRLLGARVVAHNGGEVIQAAALAIRARMTVDDLAGELFPYLTLAESLKLCAQTFTRDVSATVVCAPA